MHVCGVSIEAVAHALGRCGFAVRSRRRPAEGGAVPEVCAAGGPEGAAAGLSGEEAIAGLDETGAAACRIRVGESTGSTTLVVEIRGAMPRMDRPTPVSARITLADVVSDGDGPHPVVSRSPRHRDTASDAFCLTVGLGVVQPGTTVLSQWMKVAEVPVEWLQFPSKGRMTLAGRVHLLCGESGRQLAAAQCTFEYTNPELGYLDAECSLRKANTLAVSLALAVTSAHSGLSAAQVGRLRDWAKSNILKSSEMEQDTRRLDRALEKAAVFFAHHHKVDLQRLCGDVAEIVPADNRCRIFELCLDAVRARGFADQQDLSLLDSVAAWLEIDRAKAATLFDDFLPATIRSVDEPDAALGITTDMSPDDVRRRLNAQYRKWHARVTSPDPEVRAQADAMLTLISSARSGHDAATTMRCPLDTDGGQEQAEEAACEIHP